jgi:hypothetical protein
MPGLREMMREAVRKGHCLPLLTRHGIYLWVLAGDGPRFARNFRETWGRIPLGPRRELLAYWKDNEGIALGCTLPPTIELLPRACLGRRTFGICKRRGHLLQFAAEHFDRMPDDVVQDVIAHELAHAYQDARGIHLERSYRDGREDFHRDGEYWGGRYEIETDADEHIEWWGFDADSVDRWSLEAGITKVVEPKDPRAAFLKEIARLFRLGR